MNAARDHDEDPCINPTAIMHYSTGYSDAIDDFYGKDNRTPYIYRNVSMCGAAEQANNIKHDTHLNLKPLVPIHTSNGEPSRDRQIIQCKLFFLIAAHKTVQTGKQFVAVARITKGRESPFVNAQGKTYFYIPETKHQQFNTSTPLSDRELAGAICDERAFVIHKTTGTSCAPAGTYLVYRLNCSVPGVRNLRFEAFWDWGNGFTGKAAYDFVSLTAHDDCIMKPYTTLQKKLLNELWPGWERYMNC
ncbi:hypothetical protein F4859DRAFT_529932 [Xylaria cf. heliscus]|nr:hypothetical protein F4859DRAFT_529932 [Xylaria cf. heliscus]